GIGEATALELSKYKVNLVLAARREDRLKQVAKKAEANGSKTIVVKTDLIKYKDIQNLVIETLHKFGRIDVLINVAGWGAYGWLEELSASEIKNQYTVNIV